MEREAWHAVVHGGHKKLGTTQQLNGTEWQKEKSNKRAS